MGRSLFVRSLAAVVFGAVVLAGGGKQPEPSAPGGRGATGSDPGKGVLSAAAAPRGERRGAAPPVDGLDLPLYRAGEILVVWRPGVSAADRQALHAAFGSTSLAYRPGLRLERVGLAAGLSEAEAISRYRLSGLTVSAERNALRYPLGGDPYLADQWPVAVIGMDTAWRLVRENREIVIGVVDTGIDSSHPDLSANIWVNQPEADGVKGEDDDNNGYVDDVHGWDFGMNDADPGPDTDPASAEFVGHATGVAGVLAAVGGNGIGTAGVLWRARLANLKAWNSSGMDVFAIASALDYARGVPGLRIVNCSFGGDGSSDIERQAFERLNNDGILAVCAAGNRNIDLDAQDPENAFYPAGYRLPNMITVAATDAQDALAIFSNFGTRTVQVAAPGVVIFTSGAMAVGDGVQVVDGTSFAAPFVVGLAAMLLAVRPEYDVAAVREAIIGSVDVLPDLAGKVASGGRVNMANALRRFWRSGDMNQDLRLDVGDALHALEGMVRSQTYVFPALGETSGDGRIGAADAVRALRQAAGMGGG